MVYFEKLLDPITKSKILSGDFRNILFISEQGLGKDWSARKLQKESKIPIFIKTLDGGKKVKVRNKSNVIIYTTNYLDAKDWGKFDLIVEVK